MIENFSAAEVIQHQEQQLTLSATAKSTEPASGTGDSEGRLAGKISFGRQCGALPMTLHCVGQLVHVRYLFLIKINSSSVFWHRCLVNGEWFRSESLLNLLINTWNIITSIKAVIHVLQKKQFLPTYLFLVCYSVWMWILSPGLSVFPVSSISPSASLHLLHMWIMCLGCASGLPERRSCGFTPVCWHQWDVAWHQTQS